MTFIDDLGHRLKQTIFGLKDDQGNVINPATSDRQPLSAFGESLTAQLSPVFQGSFEYTVDNTELTQNTVANGGTVTQAEAMAVCTTSTTTASTALLKTKQHARYRAGMGGLGRFTALFTTGVAGTEQYIGLFDETGSGAAFKNGYGIGMNGTDFGILRFSNDSISFVSQSSFSEDVLDGTGKSGMTLDVTKLNVFEIRFQYLGAGEIQFCIEDPNTGKFFVFHKISYANQNNKPSCRNPNFHFIMFVNNKATTSNMVLKCASYGYFIEGKNELLEIHQPEFSSDIVQKTGVTTETALFTIQNKSNYSSLVNYIDILPLHFSLAVEASSANNIANMRLIKDASLGGSPSYSDINTSDSVVEIDTAGTTVTGGKTLFSVQLANKNDRVFQSIGDLKIIIGPGETVTMSVTSANSATFDGEILWRELF